MDGLIALALAKKYANNKISELPTGFTIKPSVPTYADLPMSGNNPGDVREVLDTEIHYFWDGVGWEQLHSVIEMDTELDEHSTNAVENKAIYKGILWEKGTGDNSAQLKNATNSAEGDYSTAEGLNTLAKSDYSHTEGWATRTIVDTSDPATGGHASHAEGSHTVAKGAASHAEGNSTESMGWYSHAEGSGSVSGGISSHAEGDGAITNNYAEHAEGTYNKSTASSSVSAKDGTLHSVGIGTSMSTRKNAHEIMQNGDQYIIGVGDYDGTNHADADTVQDVIEGKQDKDPDAEVGAVAIFNNEGSTVGSGVVMEEAEGMDILISTDSTAATDEQIPTALWVKTNAQGKAVVVGSSTTTLVEGYAVPILTKIQFMELYNATLNGINGIIMESLGANYYYVGQARHRMIDSVTELRISTNIQNALFVDYVYRDDTDAITINGSAQTVTATDKLSWDGKADVESITKTTDRDATLTNHDTVVFTTQMSGINIDFDISEDEDSTDYLTGFLVKPYGSFIFQYSVPENFSLVWQDGAPLFESGGIYECSFRCTWIEDSSGNIIISGKWSRIA